MTRADYATIGIVGICLAALIYLIFRFSNIQEDKAFPMLPEKTEPRESVYPEDVIDDPYAYPDSLEEEEPLPQVVVEEPVADAPETKTTPAVAASPSGDLLVLAGSFRFKAHAENQARQLKKMGYAEVEVSLFNRGTYASVLVGRFEDYNAAQALVKRLRADGVEAYVQKKRMQ